MSERIFAEKIERWRVDELVPYARNPRTHSPDQVTQIAASIREFGFTNPVLVDRTGGIIAGHGRVLAAKELGLEEVPVVCLDHLSEAQKRAYVIADNKLALNAGWDEELLALELTVGAPWSSSANGPMETRRAALRPPSLATNALTARQPAPLPTSVTNIVP